MIEYAEQLDQAPDRVAREEATEVFTFFKPVGAVYDDEMKKWREAPKGAFVDYLVDPTDKQRVFVDATESHEFVLYGGARGGGKSYIIRWTALYFLLKWYLELGIEHVVFGLFCETFTEVQTRQVLKAKAEFPTWLGKWSGMDFVLAPEYGQGRLRFLNLDNPVKYRSAEFAGVAVDELTMNTLDTVQELWQSKRWPGIEHLPFFAGTNPGGPGHSWVKRLFINRNLPDYMKYDAVKNPLGYHDYDFCYIKALPQDNKYNPQSYMRSLNNLPPRLKRAMMQGDWDAFAGQFFDSYSRAAMDEPRRQIPEEWRLVGGYDPGWRQPASFGLYAIEPAQLIQDDSDPDYGKVRRGTIHKIFNYYVEGRNDEEHARAVQEAVENCEYTGGRYPEIVIAGGDAFQRKSVYGTSDTTSELTTADIFEDFGFSMERAYISKSSRRQTLAALSMVIDQNRLRTFEGACDALHEELEGVMADDHDPEDIKGRGSDPKVPDHALDETRGVVWYVEEELQEPDLTEYQKDVDYGLFGDEAYVEELQEEQERRVLSRVRQGHQTAFPG